MSVFDTSTFGRDSDHQTADEFIASAENLGHFPVEVTQVKTYAAVPDGTVGAVKRFKRFATGQTAVIGRYADGEQRVLGNNGARHRPTSPDQFRDIVRAIVAAGGQPVHSHAWDGKVMAQFRVGSTDGMTTNLVLGDSYDGSCALVAGCSVRRLACANQLAMTMRAGGRSWAKIRHTASLEEKVNRLIANIDDVLREGRDVGSLFARAERVHLSREAARVAFDRLFPPAAEDATQRAKTIAENRRNDARRAAGMGINRVGGPGNVATLWNAATYLVDRDVTGAARNTTGDAVGTMVLGSRGRRVETIREVIHQVVMASGEVVEMTTPEATGAGVDTSQLGAAILADMLN